MIHQRALINDYISFSSTCQFHLECEVVINGLAHRGSICILRQAVAHLVLAKNSHTSGMTIILSSINYRLTFSTQVGNTCLQIIHSHKASLFSIKRRLTTRNAPFDNVCKLFIMTFHSYPLSLSLFLSSQRLQYIGKKFVLLIFDVK